MPKKGQSTRIPIPQSVQDAVLLANRHACCVCQGKKVQLHHIDENPANNAAENIAALCLDHHDQASMSIGLTKKLQPHQVKIYKAQWEQRCADDALALSRQRFTFYYCIYKNPPRLLEAYLNLSDAERGEAANNIRARLIPEQNKKDADKLFGMNAVPSVNEWTLKALKSAAYGETYPSYLEKYKPHPADANYSTDSSTQEAMSAFHLYDLWCQILAQILAEARGSRPLEDLYSLGSQNSWDAAAGQLFTFHLSVRGKGVHIPSQWEKYPVGTIYSKTNLKGRKIKVRMQLRTMYLFSDTAALNLSQGRVSGLGIFNGATLSDSDEAELTVIPLIIGTGGWNLYPEHYSDNF